MGGENEVRENWYTLILAILSPRPLYPEEAFVALETGQIPRRELNVFAPDMLAIYRLGEDSWRIIAELYGFSRPEVAMTLASRWKRKQRLKIGGAS